MDIEITGDRRDIFGKNASRKLRSEGKIPAVLYGANTESVALTLNKKDLIEILRSESGENSIFTVSFNGEAHNAMIKMLQMNPVSDELLHVDLIQIAMDKKIKVSVPFVLKGEAVGVKTEGGFIDFVTREVEIECFPGDIPEFIEVDISELHLHQALKIEEIASPAGVTYMSDPSSVVVLVSAPTKEEEVEAEEVEEEEGVEEEESAVDEKEKTEEAKEEK